VTFHFLGPLKLISAYEAFKLKKNYFSTVQKSLPNVQLQMGGYTVCRNVLIKDDIPNLIEVEMITEYKTKAILEFCNIQCD
jgi:hypothetical protein